MPTLLFHDLRRSACRNMSEAGVSQAVAIKISVHKTDSVYRRDRIVSEQDARRAMVATETYVTAAPNAEAVRLVATANAPR